MIVIRSQNLLNYICTQTGLVFISSGKKEYKNLMINYFKAFALFTNPNYFMNYI